MNPSVAEKHAKQALAQGPRPGRRPGEGWARCRLCATQIFGNAHPSEHGNPEQAVYRELVAHLTSECKAQF